MSETPSNCLFFLCHYITKCKYKILKSVDNVRKNKKEVKFGYVYRIAIIFGFNLGVLWHDLYNVMANSYFLFFLT